ncbi:MAG: exodeoxyribonuclease III [Gammaproteobacteria bacterium]|nr:MAG: exodeoxyribonuclease III [Gammaproteobacteria bacterium]RLA16976.1 MAG: exodeoxyribonuclease III [Gammaproteobacteria bacterium]
MKIVSFNINSLRARLHQLEQIIQLHLPDLIGLQETKVHDDQFPLEAIEELGYQAHFHGQKGHYGVATLTRQTPLAVSKGFATDDEEAQRRLISVTLECRDGEPVTVINGYFPQGESRNHETKFPAKQKFYEDLQQHLINNHTPGQRLIVMGDINISPEDQDIGIGDVNRKRWLRTGKCSFLPEEREWFQRLLDWGVTDSYRLHHKDVSDRFSWFDYRSKGFADDPKRGLRIDTILATESLAKLCTAADIDYQTRGMEKPSDHCPIWAEFSC